VNGWSANLTYPSATRQEIPPQVGEKSQSHSLTRILANKRRKLVLTPDSDSPQERRLTAFYIRE
jgi:hypothetical protein